MAVSLWSPHYPYQCPDDLFAHYLRRVEPFEEDVPEHFDTPDFFKVPIGDAVTYREAHRATAAYYGMIEWMDGQFGRVIAKLEALDVLDDFAVVFLSDHGEMLGQKGLWEKQQYFEGSARVPFAVRWPQRFPKRWRHGSAQCLAGRSVPDAVRHRERPDSRGPGRALGRAAHGKGRPTTGPTTCTASCGTRATGRRSWVKHGDLKLFRFDGHGGILKRDGDTPGLSRAAL